MTTLPITPLSKPTGDSEISRGTLGYVLARDRQQAYNLIVSELKKSGIPQATLARRLRMDPAEVSRLLKRPGNWQINTFGALLFAICGGALKFAVVHSSDHSILSDKKANWAIHDEPPQTSTKTRSKPKPRVNTVFELNKETANAELQTVMTGSLQSMNVRSSSRILELSK